ncbi:MAG: hypothetical protein WB770_02335 [Acidimicrobiales bacterium]
MSSYIIAGYVIALSVLTLYGIALVVRVRAARRRLDMVEADDPEISARARGTGAAVDSP